MIKSMPLATISGRRGEASASWGQIFAGRLLLKTSMPERRRRRPFSGRFSAGRAFHLGPPTAPRRTLSLSRHFCSISGGRGSPHLLQASPPIMTSS